MGQSLCDTIVLWLKTSGQEALQFINIACIQRNYLPLAYNQLLIVIIYLSAHHKSAANTKHSWLFSLSGWSTHGIFARVWKMWTPLAGQATVESQVKPHKKTTTKWYCKLSKRGGSTWNYFKDSLLGSIRSLKCHSSASDECWFDAWKRTLALLDPILLILFCCSCCSVFVLFFLKLVLSQD